MRLVNECWKQAKGKIQEKWDKLTDDDLKFIDGRRDRLEGRIQPRYGFSPDHVRKEVDDWVRWQAPVDSTAPEPNSEIKFGAGDDRMMEGTASRMASKHGLSKVANSA